MDERPKGISRRGFLRLAGLAGGLAATAPLAAKAADGPDRTLQRRLGRFQGERVAVVPSLCEMCFWRCGILGKVKDGRLVRIEGNPDHPLTRGRICARGNAGLGLLYDPDRLKYPLQRVGARGEGRFRRISWDEALDVVAHRFAQIASEHGPDAIALFPHGASAGYFKALMSHVGSAGVSVSSFYACRGPRDIGFRLTYGLDPGSPERVDMANARLIVLIGSHIGENVHTSHVAQFADAVAAGAELVVVDPRHSVAAGKARFWLPIKPGTDTALLLAWMHELIAAGLVDRAYLQANAFGYDELVAHVQPFTPEWAAPITGIPAEAIRRIARRMGELKPAVLIHPGRHVTWYGNDVQRSRAIAILAALLGSWGRPGGYFLPTSMPLGDCPCQPTAGEHPEATAAWSFPFQEEGVPPQALVEATLRPDRPIRAWTLYGQNVLHSVPNPRRTEAALRALDFVLAVDVLPSDSVLWADIVLPESTYLERYDELRVTSSSQTPFIALRQPVVPPLYDTRGPYEIAKSLLERLNLPQCFPCAHVEEVFERRLSAVGLSFETLQRTGYHVGAGRPFPEPGEAMRFATRTGRIELFSTALAERGLPPLPPWEPPAEAPPGMLRLVYGRSPYHSFTRTANNRLLREHDPHGSLWLNDELGAALGLAQGEPVSLENQDGVRVGPTPVTLTPGIRPDVVYVVHGFGNRSPLLRAAQGQGISDNALQTRTVLDPVCGAGGLRVNYVRILRNGELLPLPPVTLGETFLERPAGRAVRRPSAAPGSAAAPTPASPVRPHPAPSGGRGPAAPQEGC